MLNKKDPNLPIADRIWYKERPVFYRGIVPESGRQSVDTGNSSDGTAPGVFIPTSLAFQLSFFMIPAGSIVAKLPICILPKQKYTARL